MASNTMKSCHTSIATDSHTLAHQRLRWLIAPHSIDEFFTHYFERKPVFVQRSNTEYFSDLYSISDIEAILCAQDDSLHNQNEQQIPHEVDVTSYRNAVRVTHNQSSGPRLNAKAIWNLFSNEGCSIRVLCPQKRSDTIWRLLSELEQAFASGCGANVYLTPSNTQGFAPHWDDVDVFILQVSGQKTWKLHESPHDESLLVDLPHTSSCNLSEDAIGAATQTLLLTPGSMLYLPRGTIHQAFASGDNQPSLHITVSTAYHNTLGDYLKIALQGALDILKEDTRLLRQSMPRDYLNVLGIVHQESSVPHVVQRRAQFCSTLKTCMSQLIERLPVDAAADQMAKRFLSTQLPPLHTVDSTIMPSSSSSSSEANVYGSSLVRLIRADCLRLCVEDDIAALYHSLENKRDEHTNKDLGVLEFDLDFAPSLEVLIVNYPHAIRVDSLPDIELSEKIELVNILCKERMACIVYDDDDDDEDDNIMALPGA